MHTHTRLVSPEFVVFCLLFALLLNIEAALQYSLIWPLECSDMSLSYFTSFMLLGVDIVRSLSLFGQKLAELFMDLTFRLQN